MAKTATKEKEAPIKETKFSELKTTLKKKELEDKLARFLALKAASSEYESLKKELKPIFENVQSATIGRFTVKGAAGFSPARTQRASSYWRWSVKHKTTVKSTV